MRDLMRGVTIWILFAFAGAIGLAQDGGGSIPDGDEERATGGVQYDAGGLSVRMNHQMQVRFTHRDWEERTGRGSFDLARYKLKLTGRVFEDWRFRFQAEFAGGSEDDSALLEDGYVVYDRFRMAQIWAGQGKAFFGRQEVTSSGNLQFVDRSIASERFAAGRDVGVAVVGHNPARTYAYQAGVYSGSGINRDEDDNKGFMVTGRIVFTVLGDYQPVESALDRPEKPRLAFGVAAYSNTTGTEGIEEEHVSRGGFEVAYKQGGFSAVGEFFSESKDPVFGSETDTDGWYLQAGYLFRCKLEVAARYSAIEPEIPDQDEREVGVALSYYLRDHDHKVQADYRTLDFDAVPFEDRDELRIQLQLAF